MPRTANWPATWQAARGLTKPDDPLSNVRLRPRTRFSFPHNRIDDDDDDAVYVDDVDASCQLCDDDDPRERDTTDVRLEPITYRLPGDLPPASTRREGGEKFDLYVRITLVHACHHRHHMSFTGNDGVVCLNHYCHDTMVNRPNVRRGHPIACLPFSLSLPFRASLTTLLIPVGAR